MEQYSIKLENVTKVFSSFQNKLTDILSNREAQKIIALKDVSLTTKRGDTVGLIGLNASGKTTLLRVISGIYSPDSGLVQVDGKLSPLLQIGTGFNMELDAADNVILYGMLLGFTKKQIKSKIDAILEFAELERFRDMRLKNFSSGMRARLGFATACQVNPDIILVDEVLAVGDEAFREKSFQAFLSMKNQKKTIVFTSHNLVTVKEIADRVILLDKGRIIKMGTPDEVIPFYREIIKKTKLPKN